MNSSDISELQKKLIAFRKERDWEQFHNPKDVAISLVLEAAELLEHFQWKSPEDIEKHLQANKDDVSDELVDVLHWVVLLAHDLDIDLLEHSKKKLAKNAAKYPVHKAKGRHAKYTELAKE